MKMRLTKTFPAFPLYPIVLIIIVLMSGTSLMASHWQQEFDRANGLYEEGQYQDALSVYHNIEIDGVHWKLFFNIGNCYYKLNDFLMAKIYYLRADRLKPFEPSIRKNIAIVNKHFSDKMPEEKADFLGKLAKRLESAVSLNVVSILLVVSVLLLNVFIFLMMYKGRSRFLIYMVSFSLVFVLMITGYHIHRVGQEGTRDTAVIAKADSQLRSGPGDNNTVLFKVNPGLKVRIIDHSRNWVQVTSSAQVAGWIEEDRLVRI